MSGAGSFSQSTRENRGVIAPEGSAFCGFSGGWPGGPEGLLGGAGGVLGEAGGVPGGGGGGAGGGGGGGRGGGGGGREGGEGCPEEAAAWWKVAGLRARRAAVPR